MYMCLTLEGRLDFWRRCELRIASLNPLLKGGPAQTIRNAMPWHEWSRMIVRHLRELPSSHSYALRDTQSPVSTLFEHGS